MLRKIVAIALVLTFLLTGCVSTVSVDSGNKDTLRFWYFESEDVDEVLLSVIRELRKFARERNVDVEYVKYDASKVSYDDYKKKLSIALSTGECDLAYSNLRTLSNFEKSLMSLEQNEVYKTLMPTLQFGKFLPLEYNQSIYGLNKDILNEYGIEYSEKIDIHEFFAIKKAYRDAGGVLLLDGIELEQLVDEVLIPRAFKEDLSNVDLKELFDDYNKILDMVYSGSYDYSDLEVYGYYHTSTRYKNDKSFHYSINSGLTSNRFNKSGLKYLSTEYFIPLSDIRFYRNATTEWNRPGLGVSMFSENKHIGEMFIEDMITGGYMTTTYAKGYTVLTGYEGIQPQRYNELLRNYVEEKIAYDAAAMEDPRYDFKSVNLGDLYIRELITHEVVSAIKKHKRLDYEDFRWEISAKVMEYMVTVGER